MLVTAMLAPLLLGGCDPCGDEVVQHEPSPYGRGTAIVYVRNCGATTDYATHVALVGHVDAGPRDRNVFFVADTNDGAAPEGPGGGPRVRVRWIDGNHLEVGYHPRARTFRKESKHGRVRITYVALP
jgi:hypothetical protein